MILFGEESFFESSRCGQPLTTSSPTITPSAITGSGLGSQSSLVSILIKIDKTPTPSNGESRFHCEWPICLVSVSAHHRPGFFPMQYTCESVR